MNDEIKVGIKIKKSLIKINILSANWVYLAISFEKTALNYFFFNNLDGTETI